MAEAEALEWEPMYGVLKQYGIDFAERYKVQAMVKGNLASCAVDIQGQFHEWVFEHLRLLDPALADDFNRRYASTTRMMEENQKALQKRRAADGARALELERGNDADLAFQPYGNAETVAEQEGSVEEKTLNFDEIGPPAERVPIGDVVYYFAHVHKTAVEQLEGQNRFARLIKDLPFKGNKASDYSIAAEEILELRRVRFEFAHPDEERVAIIDAERLTPGLPMDCNKMITFGFHESIGGDILMLKQRLDRSLWSTLTAGQGVKNFHDEGAGLKWAKGTVQSVRYDYSLLGRMCMPEVNESVFQTPFPQPLLAEPIQSRWDSDAPKEESHEYACTDIFPLSPADEENLTDG